MIIAIVGMAGSGKTETANYFKDKGYKVIRLGEIVDNEFRKLGLDWSADRTKKYREKIREELGMAAVAIKALPVIEQTMRDKKEFILDGLYSWEEYTFLKEKFPNLFLLCIYARPEMRYRRLKNRKERTFTLEEARKRDIDEIVKTNKGGPIAIADYLIKNETTKDALHTALETFLNAIKV